MFTEEFLDSLPTDPTAGLLALCQKYMGLHAQIPAGAEPDEYASYLEAYATFEAFIDGFDMEFSIPELVEDKKINIKRLTSFVHATHGAVKEIEADKQSDRKYSAALGRHRARFGGEFIYEFSDGDLSRIQELLNELRDEIVRSELFDAKHKQRILSKVESVQREMHKKITSLDKLWGLLGEAGVVLGKFGNDAKPLVDRIKEIAQMTWRTQARAEELPSGTTLPLLSSGDAEEGGAS